MRAIDKYLNRISLTGKIMIIFLGCVVIPFILQLVFYITETEKNIQAEMYQKMMDTLDDTASKIEASISDAITVMAKYSYDIKLYQCIDRDYTSDIEYLIEYQDNIRQTIKTDLPFHLQIDEISFITDNPSIFNGAIVQQLIPFDRRQLGGPLLEQSIYNINGKDNSLEFRVGLKHIYHERANKRSVSITRDLSFYSEYGKYSKVLKVELNTSYYNTLLSNITLFSNLILVDRENRILFCSNTYNQSGDFNIYDENGLERGVIVLKKDIKGLPLSLYGYYNSTTISDQFMKSITGVMMIMLIGTAIAAFFVFVIGTNLSQRTLAIVKKSEQIAKGDFSDEVVRIEETGDDEIAKIEKSINLMSLQLKEYIDKEYKAKLMQSRLEQETTQAKLKALQSQVNPHFLFNALESIRLNAIDKDKQETIRMIKRMSKMFRYLVDWDGDIIRLEKELDFLNEFLSIQKYRFGDEFNYEIAVEEQAKRCLMPKLILQPLVENACIHGVEATSNDKQILISVYVRGDMTVLTVEDNGGGLPPEKLALLQETLRGGPQVGRSVGLYNVYQRLALHYKGDFCFTIDSELGKGTICRVEIPLRYE